jgi:hypothetical protein
MDLELPRPTRQNAADKRRRAAVLRSQTPFLLRLPDVAVPVKPQLSVSTPSVSKSKPASRPTAHNQVASARARISKQRYDDGHQHVTNLIDRMRDRRRRILDRLWIASVVLTALSIVALVVEVIQNLNTAQPAAESAHSHASPTRPVARRSSPRSPRSVVPAAAQVLANELPEPENGEHPVKSALYTTDRPNRPKGVWLDGTITDNESETASR